MLSTIGRHLWRSDLNTREDEDEFSAAGRVLTGLRHG